MAAMTAPQLTVAALFWAAALIASIDAIKADDWRRPALGIIAALLAVAGFLVKPLWNVFPDVSAGLVNLTRSPFTWFAVLVVGYMVLRTPLKRGVKAKLPYHNPKVADEPPAQEIEMPFIVEKGPKKPKPLDEIERGPALRAIIEIRKFLVEDVAPFHKRLAEARNSKDWSDLLPRVLKFRNESRTRASTASILQATHKLSLKRMGGPDLTALAKELDELTKKLIRVNEGIDWPRLALLERVRPMHSCNLEVGRMVADLVNEIDAKHAEYFG